MDWTWEIAKAENIEREREEGADVCNDKNVLLKTLRLSAKTTTAYVSFLLLYYIHIV